MSAPYRTGAELVVCRPKRTLLGRLRSWWRGRLVRKHGRFRDRYLRCPSCKFSLFVASVQALPPICYECEREEWLRAGGPDPGPVPYPPDYQIKGRALDETPFDEPVKLVNARPPSRPPATPPKRPPPPKRVSE